MKKEKRAGCERATKGASGKRLVSDACVLVGWLVGWLAGWRMVGGIFRPRLLILPAYLNVFVCVCVLV